jgi:inward rectifier potassium channel
MAIFKNKQRGEQELGFGSKNYKSSVRFINSNGAINVRRTGLGGLNNIDVYNWLISASKLQLSLIIMLGYIFINLLFAGIYYLIGPEHFGGLNFSSEPQKFMSLFFFSAQTITTLGYGHIYPIGNTASVAAAVESLMGLLSFAIATGIIFGRFSRPRADILYSKNILIAPYDEITGLMFRITNKKQYELIESEANVTMTMNNPVTNRREFFNLSLEISRINFLALSWTIVHPIEETSPIYGLSISDLEDRDAEIIILIKAINDTVSQTVYSRYSYKVQDFVEKAKFKPLTPEAGKEGKLKISVTDIHHFDKVN